MTDVTCDWTNTCLKQHSTVVPTSTLQMKGTACLGTRAYCTELWMSVQLRYIAHDLYLWTVTSLGLQYTVPPSQTGSTLQAVATFQAITETSNTHLNVCAHTMSQRLT